MNTVGSFNAKALPDGNIIGNPVDPNEPEGQAWPGDHESSPDTTPEKQAKKRKLRPQEILLEQVGQLISHNNEALDNLQKLAHNQETLLKQNEISVAATTSIASSFAMMTELHRARTNL